MPAGVYQGRQIDGIGEWIMHRARIPVAEYRAYAKQFKPVKYQPAAWAKLARDTGMRYIVLTSKHHDGFALFPSDVTDWDIADATPYGKDLIGPLAEAARAEGLKFGLYHSQAQDWTHPGGAKAGLNDGEGWDEAQKGSFDAYLRTIAIPQTRDIITRYNLDILWWDTPHLMTPERAAPLVELLRLRPGIIHNNRLGGGFSGDTDTPEQHIPATGTPGRDWETCMTLNDTWGFKSHDHNWKPAPTLIRNLIDIVSKGGNYLLNIGPTAEGEIPQPSIERLQQVGAWMKTNGEAIYGTRASVFPRLPWGRCTTRPGAAATTLYLHVFDWPRDGKLVVPGLASDVTSARLLDGGQALQTARDGESVVVSLPAAAPDPVSSTVVLQVNGKPEVVAPSLDQAADGSLTLPATATEPLQGGLRYESDKDCIGFWTNPADTVAWSVRVNKPGLFRVTAELAAQGPSALTVEAASAKLTAATPDTGDYQAFRKVDLGQITLAAGRQPVRLVPDKQRWQPVNVRTLTLTPAN